MDISSLLNDLFFIFINTIYKQKLFILYFKPLIISGGKIADKVILRFL